MATAAIRTGAASRSSNLTRISGPLIDSPTSAPSYRNRLDRAVDPLLRELHHATGHVVHLGVLDGSDVVHGQGADLDEPVPQLVLGADSTRPAHSHQMIEHPVRGASRNAGAAHSR